MGPSPSRPSESISGGSTKLCRAAQWAQAQPQRESSVEAHTQVLVLYDRYSVLKDLGLPSFSHSFPANSPLSSPHRRRVIIIWEGRTQHPPRRTITVIGLETASTRFHCYSVEMVEDKISGVGVAAAASDFRDAKSALPSSALDRPESLKEPELGIPDDGDIEKVERVYRYVHTLTLPKCRLRILDLGLQSASMHGRREAHDGTGKSIEGLYRVSLPVWSR